MAATSVDLPSCAFPELGNDAPESMTMMAATSVDAALQAVIDERLYNLDEDDVPESAAVMAATNLLGITELRPPGGRRRDAREHGNDGRDRCCRFAGRYR